MTLVCEEKCADLAHPLISHSLCANYVSHMVTCMSIVQIGSQLRNIDDGDEKKSTGLYIAEGFIALMFLFLNQPP